MTTSQFFWSAWSWNPLVIGGCVAGALLYLFLFGWSWRIGFLGAGLAVVVLALESPLSALSDGYLFSAHMAQHILLLLVAPIWILLSLPRDARLTNKAYWLSNPLIGWLAGVGAMWLWHAPTLCNAAVSSRPIYALQSVSLLFLGSLFWWQVLAPREQDRLSPLTGVLYLFTACTACSVLGIILTFAPVRICAIYMQPVDRLGLLPLIRDRWGMTPEKDQQIGGLLMWVPMCLIYLAAIFSQLVRWFSPTAPAITTAALEDCLMSNESPPGESRPTSWEELPNEHLPRPTYFPAGVAMGLTFLFWGLITSYVTAIVGLGLFVAALAGWIAEIRHEHHR